ncbi:hypothetical protein [Cereibacter changlensis]|uniref:hypothetical protein n=1 Tax=Cereibacter changlensis TaxID=402884 RepID=UPI0040348FD5
MMRQPSSFAQLYQWHSDAVAGREPPQHDGLPECGWFRRKLVKSGPWVAVRIFVEREICERTGELLGPERLRCECDGQMRDPANQWTYLEPITHAEYRALLRRAAEIPAMAATMVPIDLTETPMCP